MSETVGTISVDLTLDDDKFNRALATSEAKAAAAGKAIDKELAGATSRTEARFASFGSIATKALTVTGIAAGVAGVAAVKMAGNFEQSLNVFQSVSGATAKQMELVAQKARELGQDASLPGISARDAAQALTELAKAGLTVNESLAASKGVLSLAKAGNLDVAAAAQIAAKALNAFGLEGRQAAWVADLLAAAANASTAGVDDIALGLAQVGAGAKQMGVSLQDTVTALALFANAGIRGQDAGTSLKQMFIQLAAPTDNARSLMKQLGLAFFDAKGNFVGLEKASQQLNTKLKGLTQEQRNNALATIFGSDSMRVAAILADEGAAGFDKMAAAVNKEGAATDLAAAQNKGFNGALDNFISTLQTVGTDLGTKVLPPVTQFLKVLSQQLPPAVDFATRHGQQLAIAALSIGAAFATIKLAGFISDLKSANVQMALFIGESNAAGVKSIAGLFTGGFKGASKGILSFVTALRGGSDAIKVWAALTTKSMVPLDALGKAFFKAGGGGQVLIRSFQNLSRVLGFVKNLTLIGTTVALMAYFFNVLGERSNELTGRLQATWKALSDGVGSSLRPVADALDGLQLSIDRLVRVSGLDVLAAIIRDAFKDLGPLIDGVVRGLKNVTFQGFIVSVELLGKYVKYAVDINLALLKALIDATTSVADTASTFIANFKKVVDYLKNEGVKAFEVSRDKVTASLDAMRRAAEPWQRDFGGTINATLEDASKRLIDYDTKTVTGWGHWTTSTLDATSKWATDMGTRIGNAVTDFVKSVGDNMAALPKKVQDWFDATLKSVEAWGTNMLTGGGTSASNFVTGVVNYFGDLPKRIGDKLEGIVTTVTNFFNGLPDRIKGFLSDSGTKASGSFLDGITSYIKSESAIRKIGDTIVLAFLLVVASIAIYLIDTGVRITAAFLTGIVRNIGGFVDAGVQLVKGLIKGIGDNAGAVVNKIKEICGQALDAVKKFFGIHSPSTVMADMGENLMKGLAEGIAGAGSLATSAMTGVSQDLIGALTVPSGDFNVTSDGSVGSGSSRTQNFNNVYNVYNQIDPELIANDVAWRAKHAS